MQCNLSIYPPCEKHPPYFRYVQDLKRALGCNMKWHIFTNEFSYGWLLKCMLLPQLQGTKSWHRTCPFSLRCSNCDFFFFFVMLRTGEWHIHDRSLCNWWATKNSNTCVSNDDGKWRKSKDFMYPGAPRRLLACSRPHAHAHAHQKWKGRFVESHVTSWQIIIYVRSKNRSTSLHCN